MVKNRLLSIILWGDLYHTVCFTRADRDREYRPSRSSWERLGRAMRRAHDEGRWIPRVRYARAIIEHYPLPGGFR